MTKDSGCEFSDLYELVEEFIVGANGDDEKTYAFWRRLSDNISIPADGHVLDQPVTVLALDYQGNIQQGITARCKLENGSEHEVGILLVVFPEGSLEAKCVAAYRLWLGIEPYLKRPLSPAKKEHKVKALDLDLTKPIELIVRSTGKNSYNCRLPGSNHIITLRAKESVVIVPGEIVTIKAEKQWVNRSHPYISGEIQSAKLDISKLGLSPLELTQCGTWNPLEAEWGEDEDDIDERTQQVLAKGIRSQFMLEDLEIEYDEKYDSKINKAIDLKDIDDLSGANKVLMELCKIDLRTLDAHSHLGSFAFNQNPEIAIRHCEVGVRIGNLSFGNSFDGILPWVFLENRPFLRCMQGYGLCLWRLGNDIKARETFERILDLSPLDNQGIRFILADMDENMSWEDCRD